MPQYLHFPSNHTDEEKMLQNKYAKLRRKKKALEEMKVSKPEPEKVNPLKRPLDPKDAKERAKRLILSGKINLGNKKAEVKTTFKRPRALERKILATGRSEGHGGLTPGYNASYPGLDSIQFEPFTPNPEGNPSNEKGDHHFESGGGGGGPKKTLMKPFSGVSAKDSMMGDSMYGNGGGGGGGGNKSGSGGGGGGGGQTQRPKRGPTIYIQAHNLTDEILREQFGKFGTIVNVKLNNQTVGFVTYDCVENAEVAVREMNGMTYNDISYDVQFARRQPTITHPINDSTTSATWSHMAAAFNKKSVTQDPRAPVVYDDATDETL